MVRKALIAVSALAALIVVDLATGELASAGSPIALLLPQSMAFAVLGHSCGGIQEEAFATGFDATTGYPTGEVYLQTRCGGSGRGGGYHVTTYSAWVDVTWDYTGAVTSFAHSTTAPTVDPTFSAVDQYGNQLENVTNHAYLTLAAEFVPPPRLTSISVTIGPATGGTTVTIAGTGFTAATAVSFGDTPAASFTVDADSLITAVSPVASAGTVDVTVTTAGGTSSTSPNDLFTFVGAPAVTGIDPPSGPVTGGTTVTISGANLGYATEVDFGENPAGFSVNDDSSLSATAPAAEAAEAVHVRVVTIGGTSPATSSDQFTYLAVPAPVVSSISPNSGSVGGGTTVTITGLNFSGAYEVDFGGVTAGFTVNDDSSITAESPMAAGPGAVDVTVISAGGASAASAIDQFTYTPSGCGGACVASVQCAHLSGSLITGIMTLSRCTPISTTHRRASLLAGTSDFTWKPSVETTTVSLTLSSPGQGVCSIGRIEVDITGTVLGGTSSYAAVGEPISAQACATRTGRLSLIRGTMFGL
jgi:hypothetical protein